MVHGYHASYPGLVSGHNLERVIFPFFRKDKKDLVARAVVIQSRSCGGFDIVATHLKSQALLVQWIKRFWAVSYGWRLFLVYWTASVFRASPGEVLASPFSFKLKRLPPFHAAYETPGVPWMVTHPRTFPIFLSEAYSSSPGFKYYL